MSELGDVKAPSAPEASPDIYTLLLENEKVRVIEMKSKPGDKDNMHSHPDFFAVAFAPYKLRISFPDGESRVSEGEGGETLWQEAVTHTVENVGETEAHFMIVEVKDREPEGK